MILRRLSLQQKALRLLFILTRGASVRDAPGPRGEVAVFEGITRLNAMAFWVRYPDYLANELLDLYETSRDSVLLHAVGRIFADEEPTLRADAMIRFRYGAYEKVDTELSFLASLGLVARVRRVTGDQTREADFLLMPRAFDIADRAAADHPTLAWYSHRMELVLRVADAHGDTALKRRQYLQPEYAATPFSREIPSITQRVWDRYKGLCDG